MINKNKGIATIAILGIILGILVIGGGAYYVGVNKNIEKEEMKISNYLNKDLYPLYSNLSWEKEENYYDKHYKISGYKIISKNISNEEYYKFEESFYNYYNKKLVSLGWFPDSKYQADGAGSSVLGYTKGDNIIILSHSSQSINPVDNQPFDCPCNMTFSIFSGNLNTENNAQVDEENKIISSEKSTTWVKSPKFGLFYPKTMNIIEYALDKNGTPLEDGKPGSPTFVATFGKNQGTIITWGGGNNSSCMDEDDFGEFKYGESSLFCLKGHKTWISHVSAGDTVTKEELNTFGDFILKNK